MYSQSSSSSAENKISNKTTTTTKSLQEAAPNEFKCKVFLQYKNSDSIVPCNLGNLSSCQDADTNSSLGRLSDQLIVYPMDHDVRLVMANIMSAHSAGISFLHPIMTVLHSDFSRVSANLAFCLTFNELIGLSRRK